MRRHPERLAWTILLIAFAIFCALAVLVPWSIRWYIINATDAREATLEVINGTVLVWEQNAGRPSGVTDTMKVSEGSTIETNGTSRAILTLFENSTITLFPETRVTLVRMRSPKFGLSPRPNVIASEEGGGRIRVGAAEPLDRALSFEVRSPQAVILLEEGSYSVEVTNESAEVAVRAGQAVVRAAGEEVVLREGKRTVIALGQAPSKPMPAARNLLVNGNFKKPLTYGWQVYKDQGGDGGDVDGQVEVVSLGDRRAVRFYRTGSGGNSAITGIIQKINEDVSDYRFLKLHADIRLIYQGLSGGGYQSSEYPVIIRLKYRDKYGSEAEWIHGFYYQNDANNPTQNGERVPRYVWNPYETDNLLETLDPLPFYIISLRIYASGWDYDSMVSEVGLIAE